MSRKVGVLKRQGRTNSRREEIITEAAKLFRKKGYEKTTVRDLASAVGMQSGSLFFHFRSKEAILVAVLEHALCRADAILEHAVEQARTPEQKLLAIVHAHLVAVLQEDRNTFTINLTEYRALSPESKKRIVKLRDNYEKRFGEVIEQLVESKIIGGHSKILRLFLLGALNWTIEWYKPEGELSVDQLAEKFCQLMLNP